MTRFTPWTSLRSKVFRLSSLSLLLLALVTTGCVRLPYRETRTMMGTEVTITIYSVDSRLHGSLIEAAADSAFAEIDRVANLAQYKQLAELNGYAGYKAYPIGDELIGLIDHAYDISHFTYGKFRPDLGPLVRLWGINTPSERVPEMWEIDSALAVINRTTFTELDSGFARLDPKGASLELGGIAKGYAVDRAAEVLDDLGVTAAMVWAGGDLRVVGTKPDGSPWRIAVRHPRRPDDFLSVITIDSGAVATSGDYERYFEKDGVRYHHIFDPDTGYPARASVSSTVVGSSCMDADAYATAMFVLGPEEGVSMANRLSLTVMIAAERDGELVIGETDSYKAIEDGDPTP